MMTSLAVKLVRAWTHLYTWRLPVLVRDERRAEINSDLWECQHDGGEDGDLTRAAHLVARLVMGIAHDLSWRMDVSTCDEEPAVRSFAVAATVTGPRRLSAFAAAATIHAVAVVMVLWIVPPDVLEPRGVPFIDHARGAASLNGASLLPPKPPTEVAMHTQSRRDLSSRIGFFGRAVATIATMVASPVTGASSVPGQVPSGRAVAATFEAASIKPHDGGGFSRFSYAAGGRVTVINVPLRRIMLEAFRLKGFQLVGGPDWIDAPFDIVAKADGNPPVDQLQTMLQALLLDRFKLVMHPEMRQLPIYALTIGRSDRRVGPQLRRSGPDCAPVTLPQYPGGAPPPPPPPPEALAPAGSTRDPNRLFGRCASFTAPGYLSARGVTIEQLANILGRVLGRDVADRTALAGTFDLDLKYQSDQAVATGFDGRGLVLDPTAPAVFTAVQEQLGLKLESTRGPVEVFVIDSIERPRPD